MFVFVRRISFNRRTLQERSRESVSESGTVVSGLYELVDVMEQSNLLIKKEIQNTKGGWGSSSLPKPEFDPLVCISHRRRSGHYNWYQIQCILGLRFRWIRIPLAWSSQTV